MFVRTNRGIGITTAEVTGLASSVFSAPQRYLCQWTGNATICGLSPVVANGVFWGAAALLLFSGGSRARRRRR